MQTFAKKQVDPLQQEAASGTQVGTAAVSSNQATHTLLQLQRVLGNQAVQRLLVTEEERERAGTHRSSAPALPAERQLVSRSSIRTAPQHTSPQRTIQRQPDQTQAEPILPTASDAGHLREEAAALLQTLADAEISDPQTRTAMLRDATYLVVGNRLSWYSASGALIQAFSLAPGGRHWAPGLYYRTPDDAIYRYIRLAGTPVWAPWVWSTARVGVIRNWLRPQDRAQFDQVIQGYGGAPVMIVIPASLTAARRDSRAAEQLVAQVRSHFEGRRTSTPSSSSATGESSTQSPATPDQRTPQQRIGEPPDRLTVWSNEQGVYTNIFVDQAVATLEVDEGESPTGLQERVQQAADDLRRARDPAQSVRVTSAVTTTGFTGTSESTPPLQGSQHVANAPAYPASIINYGPDVTVPGAVTRLAMRLDYAPAGADTLSQVAARMQPIRYYWELLDVTNLSPQAQQEAGRRRVGSGEQVTHGQATGRDISAEAERVGEDTLADVADLAQSQMPWEAKVTWLGVIGISNVVRMVGAPISSFVSLLAQPLNEQRVTWSRQGDFLLRCVATPSYNEDDPVIRASSVATIAVRVEAIHRRAATVADRTEQEIAALEQQREQATSEADRTALDRQLAALRQTLTATTGELGANALQVVNQQLAVAEAFQAANQSHTPRTQRTPAVRLLAVQLELAHLALPQYIQTLQRQKREIEARLGRTAEVGQRMPNGNYHPRVVLVSEETGQVNDLIMVLGEASDSTEGHRHYLLADVTIPNPRDRYIYEGRSTATGHTGHGTAIRNAFVDFRENNGYGRGTIAIRLPSTLERAAGGPLGIEPEMRSAPGTRDRVMQRLRDLATAAEIAGLFLSGPAALAVGAIGGVAGAIVAIDSIERRRAGTAFSWTSFETIMDISSIVGGAVGVTGVGVLPLRNLPRWASRVERVQGMLHIFGVTQLGSQVIVIPVQLELQLRQIDEMPDLAPGERAARRAEAFLQAVRAGVVTTVSAAQMLDTTHSMESPPRATEAIPEPVPSHGEPAPTPDTHPPSRPERPSTPERPAGAAERPTTPEPTPRETPGETPAPAPARSPRVAALEASLGDLQGQVVIVESDTLRGRSARVRYREGVRIEIGPNAGPAQIRSHVETARILLRYQGPLGALRRLLSRITQVFTRIPGYGTRGFESRLEVRKLRQILDTLQQSQAMIEQRFETMGSRESAPTAREQAAIQREIETLEYQLRYHEELVNSLDPGSGHVAAFDTVTETMFAGQAVDLRAVEAAINASSLPRARATIDQVAQHQATGRVQGLEGWLTETARNASDRTALGQRIGELESVLSILNDLPPGTTVTLDYSPAMGRFRLLPTEPGAVRAAPPAGSVTEQHRNRYTDPADQRAFDTYVAEEFDALGRDPEPALSRIPQAVVDNKVRRYRERIAAAQTRAARARGYADPLNPGLPRQDTRTSGVEVYYERRAPDGEELTQADALTAATGERIRVFGDDFPGIDGTIGDPPRAMQLKNVEGNNGAVVRARAAQALVKATRAGTLGVEVHIHALALTREQVQRQWNDPDPFTRQPANLVFSGSTIRLVDVWCSNGRLRITMSAAGIVFTEL